MKRKQLTTITTTKREEEEKEKREGVAMANVRKFDVFVLIEEMTRKYKYLLFI